jgi:CHASE3 domain sensor protein
VLSVATLVAIGAAPTASHHLTQARDRVVDRVDVAANTSLVLGNAMVNQETGVRGFVLGGEEGFLDPYRAGVANARRAERELQALAQGEMGGRLPGNLAAVRRAIDAWESEYAQPTIERIRRFGAGRIENAAVAAGKSRFDAVRASLGRMQADLRADRADARADLDSAAASLTCALVFAAILLALALLAIAIMGRQVIAVPIARLARQTRTVASGELDRVIEPSGRATSSASGATWSRCASGSSATSRPCAPPRRSCRRRRSRSSAPTPSSSSSPTSPPTISRSRCAR